MTTIDTSILPPADAEQWHLVDEIQHADQYSAFQHEFAVHCGSCGRAQPVTIAFGAMPEEAGS